MEFPFVEVIIVVPSLLYKHVVPSLNVINSPSDVIIVEIIVSVWKILMNVVIVLIIVIALFTPDWGRFALISSSNFYAYSSKDNLLFLDSFSTNLFVSFSYY